MKVMKYGGTSVGTPARMKEVTQLVIKSGEPVFVVLSAMSGTTNSLVEISNYLYKKNPEGANEVINNLERNYIKHIDELYAKIEDMNKCLRAAQTAMATLNAVKGHIFDMVDIAHQELGQCANAHPEIDELVRQKMMQ